MRTPKKKPIVYGYLTKAVCQHCKKSFIAVNDSEKYCQHKCAQAALSENSKKAKDAKEAKMMRVGC